MNPSTNSPEDDLISLSATKARVSRTRIQNERLKCMEEAVGFIKQQDVGASQALQLLIMFQSSGLTCSWQALQNFPMKDSSMSIARQEFMDLANQLQVQELRSSLNFVKSSNPSSSDERPKK